MRFDYTGDAFAKDTFSLVLLAVARHFGRDTDYDAIHALSTNAFAPAIRPAEPCRITWRLRDQGRCMDLVAERLGLELREVKLPPEQPRPLPDERGRTWGTPAFNKWLGGRMIACSQVLRRELDAGAIILTDGGWDRAWHQWGVITQADPDGAIIGMTPDRPDRNRLDHDEHYWVVKAREKAANPHGADLEMLRRTLHRIRGDQAPFLPGDAVFGLQAMDLWIAQMQKPAFQEDDATASAGNARLNGLHSFESAQIAARRLRKIAPDFGVAAQGHLESAAARYDRMAALLLPSLSGEGAATYAQFMSDSAKRKDHVENVLKPVKTELAAAGADIENALDAAPQLP